MSDAQLQKSNTWQEILAQGETWQATLQEMRDSAQLESILAHSSEKTEWIFVGCGTSLYLAEAAANSWTLLTGRRARALPASEVLLFPKLIQAERANAQAVIISRSGQTSEAVRAAALLSRELRIPTLGITCGEKTVLEQTCDSSIVLRTADEKSTVMTRSFTSMLLTLQVLAARRAGNVRFVDDLQKIAVHFASRIPPLAEKIESFVAQHSFADYVFLGQGPLYGITREAALKVMEMSRSYSQFFHALEFRHGPKAIVSPATCLTFFLSETGRAAEKEVLSEMKDLGATTIAICNRADESIRRASDLVVEIDCDVSELALLAPYVVPCQLLGVFTGLQKGLDPDNPKNLTRVVMLD